MKNVLKLRRIQIYAVAGILGSALRCEGLPHSTALRVKSCATRAGVAGKRRCKLFGVGR